jgi:hypothetical protein
MITAADEDAIKIVPADAWQSGIAQDGTIEEDKHVAKITRLMSRAGNWPSCLRWIGRRVKPFRRQTVNLTAYVGAPGITERPPTIVKQTSHPKRAPVQSATKP